MSKHYLTDKAVKSLKTSKAQEDFWDTAFRVRGVSFGVRVTVDGSREYVCRYRNAQGSRRRVSLGDANLLSLADAHKACRDIASKLDKGVDSAQERNDYKAADTFTELSETYLRLHAEQVKKDKGSEDRRIINRDLLPAWGKYKACDIRRRDVIVLLDQIAIERKAPVMANRTRALISKIFNFALEREFITTSPCSGLPRIRREVAKERFLQDGEIERFWKAVKAEPEPFRNYFMFLLLTGQRPGEVAGARWCEIEGDIWVIPAARTKNGRTQRVPISSFAAALITEIKLHNKKIVTSADSSLTYRYDEYLFPTHRSDFLKPRTIQHAVERLNTVVQGHSFTAHDIRRTVATGLRRLRVSRETVSRILNHTTRSVTLVYDRYDELPEMRKALEKWGEHVFSLGETQSDSKKIKSVA